MIRRFACAAAIAAVVSAAPLLAQSAKAAKKPANATAECSDGTFSTAKTQSGACSKHGGVKTWFGAPAAADAKGSAAKGADAKGTAKGSDTKSGDTKSGDTRAKSTAKSAGSEAKATGTPPAGATGQCSDGSYTRAKTQTGACSNHGGVKTWFADATGAPPAASSARQPAPTAAPAPAPTPAPAPAPAAKQPAPTRDTASTKQTTGAAAKTSGKAPTVAPPAGTPEGATAKCGDGTYSFSKTHTGACSRHGGVSEWYK